MEADQNNDATVDFNTIIVIMLQGIHQMFSPIWFTNFSHKYFLIFYWSKTGFFFPQFASSKRNHDNYSLQKLADSEFKIGETI